MYDGGVCKVLIRYFKTGLHIIPTSCIPRGLNSTFLDQFLPQTDWLNLAASDHMIDLFLALLRFPQGCRVLGFIELYVKDVYVVLIA